MRRITVLQHQHLASIGQYTDHAIGDDGGDPDAALRIECQAVRISAVAEGGDGFLSGERSISADAKARQATSKGFIDVEPLTVRTRHCLVGVAQPVGYDARAALVHDGDKAIGDVLAVCQRSRLVAGANGEPGALAVLDYKVRRR